MCQLPATGATGRRYEKKKKRASERECVKTVVCTETNKDSAKGNRVENLTGQQCFGRGEL